MCMMIYVASDYALPTLAWDKDHPRFHVTGLTERDEPVRKHFSKPFVYYVGSHQGCGCGFQFVEHDFLEHQYETKENVEADKVEIVAAHDSCRRLAEFLSVALQHQATVEMY